MMRNDTDKDKFFSEDFPPDEELKDIIVRGAREHNLQSVNADIPRDQMIVITGLSGSGKSSLAFDTLYAEGQRRYVECLSSYARQFLGMMKKPDVDRIDGLSPAISIEQKTLGANPRSTVGTVTEIYDYLRLLFAKIGKQYCVDCQVPVEKKSQDSIVEEILKNYSGKRIQILSPLVRARKGHYRDLFEQLMKLGFTRVRVDGEIKEITPGMQISRYKTHDIELVVDRCEATLQHEQRINESVALALKRSDGNLMLLIEKDGGWEENFYSTAYSCPSCGRAYEPLAPNMFSFNSPYGACHECQGLGIKRDFNRDLMIPDKTLSINNGGIVPLGKKRQTWMWTQVKAFAKKTGLDLDMPIKDIPDEIMDRLLHGAKSEKISVDYKFSGGKQKVYFHEFIGLIPNLRHIYETTGSASARRNLESFMSSNICKSCGGGRLRQENLSVYINGKNIHDLVKPDIQHELEDIRELEEKLDERDMMIANLILKEIIARLQFLNDVGLTYLSLERSARSLSGGE